MFFADPSSLRYVSDQYNTQQICDEAVDDFLPIFYQILLPIASLQVKWLTLSGLGFFWKYDDLEEAW